ASIWAEYMKIILEGKPIEWYTDVPNNVIFVNVCKESGKLANEACPVVREAFIKGTEPRSYCPVHSY
ncbi:MAG TPA: hypothetical protein PLQ81_05315, partial [bacterium]|nr:hypothetical protein [bacterium]